MADSWQQINDDGVMMDWSSVDSIKLVDLWHGFETLRRAMMERVKASYAHSYLGPPTFNYTRNYSTFLAQDVLGVVRTQIVRLSSIYDTCSAFDWQIFSSGPRCLVFSFVDDDNPVTNLSLPLLRNWTEATILASIGDAARVIPSKLSDLPAWFFQRHKIINKLRRVNFTAVTYFKNKIKEGEYATWLDLYNDWNAMPWSDGDPGGGQRMSILFPGAPYSGITNVKTHGLYHGNKAASGVVYDDIQASCEFYAYMTPRVYWDDRYGYAQGLTYGFPVFAEKSFDLVTDLDTTFEFNFGDPMQPLVDRTDNGAGSYLYSQPGLFDFRGANGFKFRNW